MKKCTDTKLKIVECPRDAMQGIHEWIPTQAKLSYIQQLLKVGFDTLDFGSFVSPKAVPQMKDTLDIYHALDLSDTDTKLLAIVVNQRGAKQAASLDQISYLGYPFSVSETFQIRNTNSTIEQSLERVAFMQELCLQKNKELVIYISMGFGNPYGDPWNAGIVLDWVKKLDQMGIKILSLSDTIGVSTPESISYLFEEVVDEYPHIEFGAHLHTLPDQWEVKIAAAYQSGCRRFDGAIKGFGGCPMAKDDLTGNMPTENMIDYFGRHDIDSYISEKELKKSIEMALKIFPI